VEHPKFELRSDLFQEWIDRHEKVLAARDVSIKILRTALWKPPTFEEMEKLAKIAGVEVPAGLKLGSYQDAVIKFKRGDTAGAADCFERSLEQEETPNARNNLAFCQILLGQLNEALQNLDKAIARDYQPLFGLNKGLVLFLTGDRSQGITTLRDALARIRDPKARCDTRDALYVLLLNADGSSASAEQNLPIDAAILINLAHMGAESAVAVTAQLAAAYPSEYEKWIPFLP
jgi:tetratricopeptide (TPR) repeat protein